MKSYYILLLSLFAFLFTSCEVIGAIFKAGVWVGVLVVVAIIALVIWLISALTKKK